MAVGGQEAIMEAEQSTSVAAAWQGLWQRAVAEGCGRGLWQQPGKGSV